jgi:hypothetical protein
MPLSIPIAFAERHRSAPARPASQKRRITTYPPNSQITAGDFAGKSSPAAYYHRQRRRLHATVRHATTIIPTSQIVTQLTLIFPCNRATTGKFLNEREMLALIAVSASDSGRLRKRNNNGFAFSGMILEYR